MTKENFLFLIIIFQAICYFSLFKKYIKLEEEKRLKKGEKKKKHLDI